MMILQELLAHHKMGFLGAPSMLVVMTKAHSNFSAKTQELIIVNFPNTLSISKTNQELLPHSFTRLYVERLS